MRRVLEWGGIAAGIALIVFGAVVIAFSINGHQTVKDELERQQITGTPDMTPKAIKAEADKAALRVTLPSCSVAGKPINTGARARCFAQYMNIHALEATGGLVYSQLPRYASADGKGTDDPAKASKGPNGQPIDNPARTIWITETALSTALNVSYMATQLALFSLLVGVALMLAGIGFIVLVWMGLMQRVETTKTAPAGAAATQT
jgi:hypothetical protein